MNAKSIIRVIEADGWFVKNQKGSHRHFIHPTKPGKVQVPMHGNKDFPPFIVHSILKQAGLR